MNIEHLALTDWPFQVVPDERSAQLWAGRDSVRRELKLLLRNYSRAQASSINLLWAFFGAGKTHFLKHLAWQAEVNYPGQIQTFYSVFPKTIRNFMDMHRILARNWDAQLLLDSYTALENQGLTRTMNIDEEFLTACRSLAIRPELAPTILDWLRAGKPTLREIREAGMSQRIDSSERAVDVCAAALKLITRGQGLNRVVWMIDEFQRIGELRTQQRNDVNIGLHSVFNELPSGFSLLLSFSFGEARNIKYLLSDEVLDRANMERFFQLPLMSQDEAVEFVLELLRLHRLPESEVEDAFPFEKDAIEALIQAVDEDPRLQLKPRTLMQVFNAVLSEADLLIEEGDEKVITRRLGVDIYQSRAKDVLAVDTEDSE